MTHLSGVAHPRVAGSSPFPQHEKSAAFATHPSIVNGGAYSPIIELRSWTSLWPRRPQIDWTPVMAYGSRYRPSAEISDVTVFWSRCRVDDGSEASAPGPPPPWAAPRTAGRVEKRGDRKRTRAWDFTRQRQTFRSQPRPCDGDGRDRARRDRFGCLPPHPRLLRIHPAGSPVNRRQLRPHPLQPFRRFRRTPSPWI
jgi:hypothetical protein